jgi:deoxyribodipyrimidine photolyase-like uncharacterized protein
MIENSSKLEKNPRIGFTYKTLNSMPEEKIDGILADSKRFFKSMK